MASKNVALCPNSFSLSFPKYACSEAFSVHKARRQCKFEGKSHLWISVMYRFSFAKVNAREFLTRFSKYFVLFFMHVNGCQCWYFVWDMHVVFLPSCSMNKTVLQYSKTVEDRLVTKVSWKTSCVKLRTEIQNRRFLFQPLKVSFSITIFSWRMYIQSDSAVHHDKPITLTDFFLCSRGNAIFLFCWKTCACFETFFRRIEKKKKKTIIFGGNPKPGGS